MSVSKRLDQAKADARWARIAAGIAIGAALVAVGVAVAARKGKR